VIALNTHINSIELFHNISEDNQSRIMHCFNSKVKRFSAGETICFYDEIKNDVGIIESGKAVVVNTFTSGSQTILEYLTKGSLFGQLFYFHSNTEGISVIATTDCTVRYIDYNHIMHSCTNACAHHSQLIQNLFSIISYKASELSEHIDILSQRTIREKLLAYFTIQSSKSNSQTFKMPFSLSTLADYLSVDRSAMMRELKKIKDDGLISTDNKIITISDDLH